MFGLGKKATPVPPEVLERKHAVMTDAEIEERVATLTRDVSFAKPESVTPQAAFETDLGMDALDVVELLMEVESEFGIAIDSGAADRLTTVGRLADHVKAEVRR